MRVILRNTYFFFVKYFYIIFKKPQSRILVYHHHDSSNIHYFENQIKCMMRLGYIFLTASEFADKYTRGAINDNLYACITFDDGFDSTYRLHMPILLRYKIRPTIFLNQKLHELCISESLSRQYIKLKFPRLSQQYNDLRGLSGPQIREMIDMGFEFGGHTLTHPNLALLEFGDLEIEINSQIASFKSEFDYQLRCFAYPYGRKRNYNCKVLEVVRDSEFEYAFIGISKSLVSNLIYNYEIPRTYIKERTDNVLFRSLLCGSSDLYDKLIGEH